MHEIKDEYQDYLKKMENKNAVELSVTALHLSLVSLICSMLILFGIIIYLFMNWLKMYSAKWVKNTSKNIKRNQLIALIIFDTFMLMLNPKSLIK